MAVSGGRDSIVMAEILNKWSRGLKLQLAVAHVHHGPAVNADQSSYRDRAREFTERWARSRGLDFYTNENAPPVTLTSEQAWRDWREAWFKIWVERGQFDTVALAHHREDLLETRMLRLVRGSGAQGLRAMSPYKNGKWRPMLEVSVREMASYAETRGLQWIQDPSNSDSRQLRNWMRREWLPRLEERVPGALGALSRSLENLIPPPEAKRTSPLVGLKRKMLHSASEPLRRELVARYLRALGMRGYQRTHVEEILKRVQTAEPPKGRLGVRNFEILGFVFHVSRDLVWASRV